MQHEVEHRKDGVAVLRVSGDVDVSHALVLRGVLGDLLAEPTPLVLVDCSDVGFVDSAGVGLLVTGHRRAQEAGGRLDLAGLQPAVAHVLQLTRADRLLTVHADVESGIAALSPAT
jgi:anti-sigma B factor antagonist